MGQRFDGGTRTEDCGHGLRVDSIRGNFGALLDLHGEERRNDRPCSMTMMTIGEGSVNLPCQI